MPKPVDKSTTYVPGLDGLRTLAVAVVILYHLNVSATPGGLLGVGIFFTLSGYLITSNLMRSWDRGKNLGLKTFWFRRFRRLAPAMISTVVAVILLSAALDAPSLSKRLGEAISSLLYVNNWYTISQETSYFDHFSGPSSLSHMWSLSVEEQFYLVWPLILLAFLVIFRSRRRIVAWATVLLALGSFALMWVLATPGVDNTRVYEGTDTRAGGLLIGAALAIALSDRRLRGLLPYFSGIASFFMGLIGIAGILAMVLFVSQENMFLYRGGLVLLTLAALLSIMAVLRPTGLWSRTFGCLPMRWLGERSYGIYLWHMPAIAFLPAGWLTKYPVPSGLLITAISIGLSALSWTWFEDPIRRHGVIPPIQAWWNDRKTTKEATPSTNPNRMRIQSYPGAFAGVTLVALIAIGTPTVLAEQEASGSPQAAPTQPKMMLNPTPSAAAPTPPPEVLSPEGITQMSCSKVIHIGDSTSVGMFDAASLPDPADVATLQYTAHGAPEVLPSVFGARSTTEWWDSPDGERYPSGVESIDQLLAEGQPEGTCWVIATGVNDAANIGVGMQLTAEDRIRAALDRLKGQRVMWATTKTRRDYEAWDDANMAAFNEELKRVSKEYPNVVIYDWAAEVSQHMEWFLDGDDVHYNPEGNAARGRRFSAALAQAFPKGDPGEQPGGKIVGSGL